ncbi:MAG: hypothetical protein IT298_10600 [Chloroflexi bacterium]|jgi:hypothetical protein|nr:hypothetical protein [Anaerolineae bacterium]MCC6566202.1 hypothetical protein [Chloroflexota bacterium]MDL1914774.1 hypothetical protein [Anaerolineae bacterium CFX4]MCO6442731.1 hypothetical protein [Anaerolineae bacterium]MEB2364733.1 hypothetical protein [Chloroflexota bacterium]
MSSTGNPKPADETPQAKRRGWGGIALAVILIALAVLIGTQILGVLYGLLFPPSPPLPDSFTLLQSTSPSYGVDDWLYASSEDACRVARDFERAGASCTIAPGICNSGFVQMEEPRAGSNVARCTGEFHWSIFAQRYYANIAAGYGDDQPTRVRIEREIFWTGVIPEAAPVQLSTPGLPPLSTPAP